VVSCELVKRRTSDSKIFVSSAVWTLLLNLKKDIILLQTNLSLREIFLTLARYHSVDVDTSTPLFRSFFFLGLQKLAYLCQSVSHGLNKENPFPETKREIYS
jgi:hypothetical protein